MITSNLMMGQIALADLDRPQALIDLRQSMQ